MPISTKYENLSEKDRLTMELVSTIPTANKLELHIIQKKLSNIGNFPITKRFITFCEMSEITAIYNDKDKLAMFSDSLYTRSKLINYAIARQDKNTQTLPYYIDLQLMYKNLLLRAIPDKLKKYYSMEIIKLRKIDIIVFNIVSVFLSYEFYNYEEVVQKLKEIKGFPDNLYRLPLINLLELISLTNTSDFVKLKVKETITKLLDYDKYNLKD